MRTVDTIIKKRDGHELQDEEIAELIAAFTLGEVPDYQMASWLMAVFFRGMSDRETAALTMAMANSGETVDLSAVPGVKVDKHSTGGVADTTTLVVAPLVAAAGVPVAKMSGRGLGFTGGTIDKLEAIPGFQTTLSKEEFLNNLKIYGLAITGQTADIAPADGKMYALRDVTGTIESIPLIASSIMSKKIAAGADKIVLDVKVGSGAFMKTPSDAIKLAEAMVRIGYLVGRETMAVISGMFEPLGRAVGNSLEVKEALEILGGKRRDEQLAQVCLTLAAHMLVMAGVAESFARAQDRLDNLLAGGQGLAKFAEMVKAQGGDPRVSVELELLPQASITHTVTSNLSGYVQTVDAAQVGYGAMRLGAGREYKGQQIDLGAGLMMECRIGDYVKRGEPLAILYTNDQSKLAAAAQAVSRSIVIGDMQPDKPPVILGTVTKNGFTPA